MKKEDKKDVENEAKKCVVFIPSGYDIILKTVPAKEFFENKRSDQQALEDFNLDEKTELRLAAQQEIETEYAERLDTLACRLPEDLLKNLAITYMDIRNLKGKVNVNEGMVSIVVNKGKHLILRLDHILNIICSAPTAKNKKFLEEELKRMANYYKKIDKTSKIDASTRKSF
jgi:hypothetical protein